MRTKLESKAIVRRGVLLILVWIPIYTALCQDTISLFECHRSAMETHPFNEQRELYLLSKELNLKNHSVNWFPSLDLNGRYTWQNEVVQLPFADALPGFDQPYMPHYNYKLTLDVQQTVYDGGLTSRARELEESRYEVNRQKVEVSLNQLKEQVNGIYFFILVLQQQEKTMQLKLNVLEERISAMESGVRNESILTADMNVLKAEKLKADQQLAEISINRKSALAVLEEITLIEIPAEPVLLLPTAQVEPTMEAIRPEQVLYDLQIKNLDASINLSQRQRYPKAFVFGQLGYGNPALNFFRDEFRGYYILGAGLQWNVWDWSKTSRTRQDMAVQQELIKTQKDAFDKNLSIQVRENMSEIMKFEEAVQRDTEILGLREEITKSSASKLENGVITPSQYILELNAEMEARVFLELHRIQLEQARINYLTTKGII